MCAPLGATILQTLRVEFIAKSFAMAPGGRPAQVRFSNFHSERRSRNAARLGVPS